jgi:hypothetical protein
LTSWNEDDAFCPSVQKSSSSGTIAPRDVEDALKPLGYALAYLQQKYVPKPCPICGAIGIRKGHCFRGGLMAQRLRCEVHGYYYDPDLINSKEWKLREAVNEHIFNKGSQESKSVLREMAKVRDGCLDYLGIVNKFHPTWYEGTTGGCLVPDASSLPGTDYMVHAAFDCATGDSPCYWLYETEDESTWEDFFTRLDCTGYKVNFSVSDKGPLNCLKNAFAKHYPNVPHQFDWVHELDSVKEIIPPRPKKPRKNVEYQTLDEQRLYRRIIQMYYAPTKLECEEIWQEILAESWEERTTVRGDEVIELLKKDYSNLLTHYTVNGGVAHSNLAETSFGRFKHLFVLPKKGVHLRNKEDIQKMNNVLWAAFRSRPMYESGDKRKRNKSTLELARVQIKKNDIWQFMR